LIDQLAEALAVEVLHHEVREPVAGRRRTPDLEQPRVLHARRDPVLGEHPLDHVAVLDQRGLERLDRDALAGCAMFSEVHRRRAAARDLGEHGIPVEAGLVDPPRSVVRNRSIGLPPSDHADGHCSADATRGPRIHCTSQRPDRRP
jgi:hypothetical protein